MNSSIFNFFLFGTVTASSTSTELLKIDLKTMPLSECNTVILDFNEEHNLSQFQNGIDKSQYCAHDPDGKKSIRRGDGGAPLQTIRSYLKLAKVVGVVSFGIECDDAMPSIYTRVAYYIEWIGSHVWPRGRIETLRIDLTGYENDDLKYTLSSK